MARKLCLDCGIRRTTSESPEGQLCTQCYDYAGWENTHMDDGHENDGADLSLSDNCPVCHPELDPRNVTKRTGHTNTAPRSHNSHDVCYARGAHDRTPAGRAGCRKLGGPAQYAEPTEAEIEAVRESNRMANVRDHTDCTHSRRGNGACVGRRLRALKA